jgi:hydroxymethylglutaryl-CoA reductase (NADPH)
MFIPRTLLRQLYTVGSLKNTESGVQFSVKNRLSDAQLTGLRCVKIDGLEVPLNRIRVHLNGSGAMPVEGISEQSPLPFPLRQSIDVIATDQALPLGKHELEIAFDSKPFGKLTLQVNDAVSAQTEEKPSIPRDSADDYAAEIIGERQRFIERFTGVELEHVGKFSFDPHIATGNCENFTGVAQIPIGFAGPMLIDGEHAKGEFVVPIATTEGTLIASYNRGMKVLNASGGVKCTVVADAMQRAPVFVFADAREARDFVGWLQQNFPQIRVAGESTSRVARLESIEPYQSNKFVFVRFNYTTGDAAGQNMVSKATFAASTWILENYDGSIERFYLEGNLATDKKASQVNSLRTRGKRVTAEAIVKRDLMIDRMRVEPEVLVRHGHIANIGSMLAGANNNGLHAANAIAAIFIATGQDVGNVAESSTGLVYPEVTPEGDLYLSITLPSLIVATHGGGTGLATQRECLRLLGCEGRGSVNKLAEIIAATVLAGELSLAAAISSMDWVSSHEKFGRNR